MRKSNIFSIALLSAILVSAVACKSDEPGGTKDPDPVAVESVSLDKDALELLVGENATLTETVLPEDADNKDVTWESSAEDIATVVDGVVTAVAPGEATITVITVDGEKEDACVVTVNPVIIDAEGISLNKATVSMLEGDTFQLEVIFEPANTTNKNVTWESNDESLVTVDENGLLTGIKNIEFPELNYATTEAPEPVTITAISEDGEFEASCKVLVSTLGAITFLTDDTWGDLGDGKIWSDALKASGGVETYNLKLTDLGIVARKNIPAEAVTGGGDYFTYGAVLCYPEFLCPDGWSIPSIDDYNALNLALGGTGDLLTAFTDPAIAQKYIDEWGAIYAGNITYAGALQNHTTGLAGGYWTNTPSGANPQPVYFFQVGTNSTMRFVSQWGNYGYNVRCVKDAPAAE